MATLWEYQVHVFCHSAAIAGAIAALDQAFPKDDGTPRETDKPEKFGSVLTGVNGTYYGASFVVTEQVRTTLEGMGLAGIPGITYFRCGNPDGILDTTNHAPSQLSVGQPWTWEDCKNALGLTIA